VVAAFLDEQAEVEPAVVIDEEDILAVVAPLRDVMRTARAREWACPNAQPR